MKRRRKLGGDGSTSPRSRLRALLDAVATTSQEVADAEEPESAARVLGAAQHLQTVLTDLAAADNELQDDEQHQVESTTITAPNVVPPHEEYNESLLEAFDCLLGARFLLLRERYRLAVNVAQCEVWQREYDQRTELDRQQQVLLGRQPQTLMSYLAYEENLVPSTPDSFNKSVDRSGVPLFRRKYEWSVRKWASKDYRRIIAAVAQKAQTDYTLLVAERLSLTQAAIDAVFSAAQEPLDTSLHSAIPVLEPQPSTFSLAEFHTFLQSQLADLPPHVTAEAQLPAFSDSNFRNSYAAEKALRSLSPLSRNDFSQLQRIAHLSIESALGTLGTLGTLGLDAEGVNSDAADARLELLEKELLHKLQRIRKAAEYNTPALFCNFVPLDFAKPRLSVTSALTYLPLHDDAAAAAAESASDASANNAADVVGETASLGPTLEQYWANFWVSIAETHHCESTGREMQMHWIHHISTRVNHSAFNKNELAVLEAAVQFYKRDEETAIVNWEDVAQRVSHEATQQNDEHQQRHHCNRTAFQCYEAYMKQVPALAGKRKNKQSGASKGVWTPEQDQLLCDLVNSGAYGDIKSASFWSRIAAALDDPSHSNYACRNRFIAQLKAGDRAVFRPDEDLRLQICSLVYGLRNWTKIAGHFDNRHAIRVRDRFDHLFALVGRRGSAFVGSEVSPRKPSLFAVTKTPVSLKRTTTTTSTTLRTSNTKKS